MGYPQKMPDNVSVENDLLLDEGSTTKVEYLEGVIHEWQGGGHFAMGGGQKEHNLVSLDVYRTFREQLNGSPCSIFVADVTLAASNDSAFSQPVRALFDEVIDVGCHALRLRATDVFAGHLNGPAA